ncbi:MAG: hypothetical protein NVS2B9_19100 [Myxococcales bacterium]
MLGWVGGKQHTPEDLHRIFNSTRIGRTLDRVGFCRFRHWRMYGEQGLAGTGVAVWLYGEQLTVEFADEPLAQYHVRYAPDKKHLKGVTLAHLFDTAHRSKQLPLWQPGDGEWLKVLRLKPYAPRRPRQATHTQERLFA